MLLLDPAAYQGKVEPPTPRLEPILALGGFYDPGAETAGNGKPRVRIVFKRDNPRSTVEILLARHPGGRPALVDAAGKPVKRNLPFVARNPNLGPIKVYATPLKTGPFFTQWIKTPKGTRFGYLQISGTRLSPAEIRSAVEAVRFAPPLPADGAGTIDPEKPREVPPKG